MSVLIILLLSTEWRIHYYFIKVIILKEIHLTNVAIYELKITEAFVLIKI